MTLTGGKSVSFNVVFAPTVKQWEGGNMTLTSNASDKTLYLHFSGVGVASAGQLTFSPSALNFGDVNVGTTGTQPLSMTATGASVTISSSSSSSSLFVLNGASFPLTIAKGTSVSFNVDFAPKTSGSASGTLTIVSDASNSKSAEGLSGTGTLPQYSVNLSWNASSSPVMGYNVYRSTSSNGSYTKINPAVEPATTYTDSTVVSGKTYYYEATSVDSAGLESTPTAPVKAAIP